MEDEIIKVINDRDHEPNAEGEYELAAIVLAFGQGVAYRWTYKKDGTINSYDKARERLEHKLDQALHDNRVLVFQVVDRPDETTCVCLGPGVTVLVRPWRRQMRDNEKAQQQQQERQRPSGLLVPTSQFPRGGGRA